MCINFYRLMNVNQSLLEEQLSAVIGILADLKALKNEPLTEQLENIKNTLIDYSRSQILFHNNLLSKAKNEIKDSEKFSGSSIMVETKETLQIMGI